MKRIGALVLGLLLIPVFTLPAWAGTLTTNKFLYKPSLGARGDAEKKTFDASLDRIDARLGKEIWVGDPNYGATFQDAVTAIGAAKATLRIPAGAWPVTSPMVIPPSLTLQFEDGAMLDLSGLPEVDIQGIAKGTTSTVTWTGHGLPNGAYVMFTGVTQYKAGPPIVAQWAGNNLYPFTISGATADTFVWGGNTSSYDDYVPGTDPGKISAPLIIQGEIKAGKSKIFSYNGIGKLAFIWAGTTQHKRGEVYPEWWGAVGDSYTDDLMPFNQCIAAVRTGYRGKIKLSKQYYLSDTLSINKHVADRPITLQGTVVARTGFKSAALGKPAIECVGSQRIHFQDFKVTGVNISSNAPAVAFWIGRGVIPNSGQLRFNNVGIDGYYQYGCIYDVGSETNLFEDMDIEIAAYLTGANNHWSFTYAFVVDNVFSLLPTNDVEYGPVSTTGNQIHKGYIKAPSGAPPSGSSVFYVQKTGITAKDVYFGGAAVDVFRLVDSYGGNVIDNLAGDGGPVGGYYMNITASSPTFYNRRCELRNIYTGPAGTTLIKTDSNTILRDWIVESSFTGGTVATRGVKFDLGGGAINCRFFGHEQLRSFISAGVFTGNTLDLSSDCTTLTLPAGVNRINNLIKDQRVLAGPKVAVDGDFRINSGNLFLDPYKMTWAAAAPTAGSWARGSVIWNTAATSGGSPGWVCVLDNTFGTLAGVTGSITTGASLLTVNTVTGLALGQFIDIAGVTGPLRIVEIDTATKLVTLSGNADATVAGAAVSFHNHTTAEAFKAMGNLL
jgi:hypothetical protein